MRTSDVQLIELAALGSGETTLRRLTDLRQLPIGDRQVRQRAQGDPGRHLERRRG